MINRMTEHSMFFNVEQKSDKQHILDTPDTYIGSIETVESNMWIINDDMNKIEVKNIMYTPGLANLVNEGLVNARDHVERMKEKIRKNVDNSLPVTYIDVSILEDGTIEMINDGNGIDVAKHPDTGVWIPQMIFGELRTSTNYDKTEEKIVGGKNGFGFKLVLIWSTYGKIETVDHIRKLKYVQEFHNNLESISEPIVKSSSVKPYTKITFKPDYARFGLSGLSKDMKMLIIKRIYDIAAVTDKTVKVKYNGKQLEIKTFEKYLDLYIGDKKTSERAYETPNERWEYAVSISPTHEFTHISFVNGIYTSKGGKHVDYIKNQIVRAITKHLKEKKKIDVYPGSIIDQLMLFIRCDIVNPVFDSQTKDYLNTPVNKFGSIAEVSDKFIDKLIKMGIAKSAGEMSELKDNSKSAKKTDGSKMKTIKGIPKLDDANFAGSEKSRLCTLILCEGDSAKTGVISGLKSEDRDYIGVYPLKGKVMNVRGESAKKVSENKEIVDLKKILGLETGKVYETIEDVHKKLRYGKIVFMTDQDLDGSHIKGLCPQLSQITRIR